MKASKEDMRKVGRLKKRSDFLRVQKNGQKWVAQGLILQAAPQMATDPAQPVRFGLTVSRRLSKSAVRRNRIKRRLRAIALDILSLYSKEHMDYVLIGRPETENRSYADLQKDLKWCLRKLSCLQEES